MPKRRVRRHEVQQPLDKPYRLIPLTQGQNAIVDVDDFDRLSHWNWYAIWSPCTSTYYAARREKKMIEMHNEVTGYPPGEVDHVNHDTLDNRKKNLRRCNHSENMRNRKTWGKCAYKGVCQRENGKWRASIHVNKVRLNIGTFQLAEEAARAYDEIARIYHGEFARLNFPRT